MKAVFLLTWMTLAAIAEVRPRSRRSCPPPGSPSYAGGKACNVIISPGGVGCTTAIEYLSNTPSQLGGNLFSDSTLKKHGQPSDFKDHPLCSNMLFIYVLGSVKHSLLSHIGRTYLAWRYRAVAGWETKSWHHCNQPPFWCLIPLFFCTREICWRLEMIVK